MKTDPRAPRRWGWHRPGDRSLDHLAGRLALVEARVAAAVARRRSVDPDPDDRFRGLYVSDAQVDQLLVSGDPQETDPQETDPQEIREDAPAPDTDSAEIAAWIESEGDLAEAQGADLRLRRLARSFGLDGYDVELVLVALAPDLDPRFERLYAYLQDDVSRRRASAGLALELCGTTSGRRVERSRLQPSGALRTAGLLLVEDAERPFLTRSLRVPDRVAAYLLGDDTPDPLVESVMIPCAPVDLSGVEPLGQALRAGIPLAYVRERGWTAGVSAAAAGWRQAGRAALVVDLARLIPGDDPVEVGAAAVREARLLDAGLVAGPVEALSERGGPAVRAFAETCGQVVLVGGGCWDPTWSREVPFLLDAPAPSPAERVVIWSSALGGAPQGGAAPLEGTEHFRLTPEQVVRAALAARRQAAAEGREVLPRDLQAGARSQNSAGLERLARRIEPLVDWNDLVLPGHVVAQLHELASRARHRERVLDAWGMGAKSSKGRGITALFAGESGTGKTMSAEVVAGALGLDLYVIDLSTVVDKYIGETEKNLDRIFVEADRVNGVLLFDEADAIFGKRSEVKDSHDRYANLEVAYLLQRMELFDGLAVLTTNLRSNVDDAFNRRLDAIVDFPMPEREDRLRLWERQLRPSLPRSDDLDLEFLSGAFKVSGGNIRNIAVTAAYLAAAEDRPVSMVDLIRGTEREYRKLGHLCLEAEFGPYHSVVSGSGADRLGSLSPPLARSMSTLAPRRP
ncbi:MAG: AAA family ATPase [Acidimicrobiia bacterium]